MSKYHFANFSDYFFISEYLLIELLSFKITPGLHSDHSILNITFYNISNNRGKCLWKFNTTLLHDESMSHKFKKSYQTVKLNILEIEDKGLVWEMTKIKIRSFFCSILCQEKRDKKILNEALEKSLNDLQMAMDTNPSQTTKESYDCSKRELEKIEKDELNSAIFNLKN